MKKFLAIFLALMMITTVALVSCKKDTPADDNDDWDNEDPVGDNGSDSGSDSGSGSGSDSGSDSGSGSGSNNTDDTPITNAWIDKNDKVYVGIDGTNLREGPGSGYKVGTKVNSGTELERLQTNGSWDKVKYEGVEYYVVSDLVTTAGKDFVFGADLETPVSLTINEGMQINLRTSPFYTDNEDYTGENLKNGGISGLTADKVTSETPLMKVGVSENGVWFKVTYKDGTYYIKAFLAKDGTISDPTVTPDVGGNVGGIG